MVLMGASDIHEWCQWESTLIPSPLPHEDDNSKKDLQVDNQRAATSHTMSALLHDLCLQEHFS
ncbi:hypothetical protein AMATHDRAFT_9748 [Amanita thiersii Skay4041]|uniref:Uncharacterized protein n=1 Tax=Amanita thiersii Skay4041 TaxID=703135 RepID=A0A2A9NBY5_9AGAR|nr:hypothetical protein AMATHDRAFT_9748 [Amanita thiersii Skay4041]